MAQVLIETHPSFLVTQVNSFFQKVGKVVVAIQRMKILYKAGGVQQWQAVIPNKRKAIKEKAIV
jgi:hypothetical protein